MRVYQKQQTMLTMSASPPSELNVSIIIKKAQKTLSTWIFQTLLQNDQHTDPTFLLSFNNKTVFIIGQVRFLYFL
jgi:hypothetical protein